MYKQNPFLIKLKLSNSLKKSWKLRKDDNGK